MNIFACRMTIILTLLVAVAVVPHAFAQVRLGPARLIPPPVPGVPMLGYAYRVIPGYGFRVTAVARGSAASRVGLERGDVVLDLNGVRMTYLGADVPVRAQAVQQGGWVTLVVRDVRTGRVQSRVTNLFDHSGPFGRSIASGMPRR